jgi:hypothetical protein
MDFKQSTIGDILDSEREMVLKGEERFGFFYTNAVKFSLLLTDSFISVDPDRFVFTMFLSQIKKHYTLALFSTLRLHHIQAIMDLRQVVEAGACAAYAIAHTEVSDFADIDEQGFLDAGKKLTIKRYDWLNTHFPEGSAALLKLKNSFNATTTHANIIYAQNNFNIDSVQKVFTTPFFDFEDDFRVKNDLWLLGNTVLLLVDLFYGVNKDFGVIKFSDSFIPQLKNLEAENNHLKQELMNTDRFRRVQQMVIK